MAYAQLQVDFTILVKNASEAEIVQIREFIAKKLGNLNFGFIQEDIKASVVDISVKRQG